jgi:hypothetical protein
VPVSDAVPTRAASLLAGVRRAAARPVFQVAGIYLASRLFTTIALLTVWLVASAAGWPFASYSDAPEFWQLFGGWDTSFFRRIATEGYPSELPTDPDGLVLPNAWAFLPVFPGLMAAGHALTGLPLTAAGAVIAVIAGGGAAIALHAFVAERVDSRRALWSTALFCFGPVSFILQVAYTESIFLLLVFSFLLAVARRRYWLTLPLGVVAAFTRPGALVLALLLAIEFVIRFRPSETRDRIALVISGIAVAVAGLSWPVIAGLVTGRPDAYVATEHSWWVGFVGHVDFVPLTPWFRMAGTYLGFVGVALVVVTVAAVAYWLTRPSVVALGHVTVGFASSFFLYLFAVFLPQQSLFRVALPLSPLLASSTFVGTPARRRILLAVFAVLQFPALVLLWVVGYP